MAPLLFALICNTMVATAFLSGIFGMAGGLILVGVLLAVMPIADAMVLHAVTQMAINGWRAVLWWRHARWLGVAAYLSGCAVALGLWAMVKYVPSKPIALLLLGVTPFAARLLPGRLRPNPESRIHGAVYGAICMSLMLLTGVAGPLVNSFFLGGNLNRREIVATKATCQVLSHGMKLVYFSGLVDQAAALNPILAAAAIAASMAGNTLARPVLEALTDRQFRRWAGWIVTSVAGYYVVAGLYLIWVT